jgi:hypothetical protein
MELVQAPLVQVRTVRMLIPTPHREQHPFVLADTNIQQKTPMPLSICQTGSGLILAM